jgi:hypothetical protein
MDGAYPDNLGGGTPSDRPTPPRMHAHAPSNPIYEYMIMMYSLVYALLIKVERFVMCISLHEGSVGNM